ncbi:MAG: ATP-binding protein [Candidatus Binatia bacterium]
MDKGLKGLKSKIQKLKSKIGLKGLRTFRARVFWSLIPIIILLITLLGVIDLYQQRRQAEEEFMKRGRAMAANLAFSSELGVFGEDRSLLESALRGVTGDADFAYVFIYGEDWRILANEGRQLANMKGRAWELTVKEKDQLLRDLQAFSRRMTREKARFAEFLAPIVSQGVKLPADLRLGFPGSARLVRERPVGAVRLGLSLKSVDAHIAGLLMWRAGLIVVFLVLSTLAIYVFSRRITRPIKRLTDQATQITDGYLDQVIPVDSRDEIGQLAVSFNNMTQALKGNINEKELVLAQLRELNQTLEDRIRQRTTEIETINVQLQDATRHKSQFLANVNHELRTPVSAIIGYARLVLRRTEGKIPQLERENLQKLLNTSEHLLGVINGLLDLAKIEAGRMELRMEPVRIDELIQGAFSTVEPMLKEGHVQLIHEIAPGIPTLNTDRDKLRQVILNLVGNAVKFTEDGKIKIFASQQNGSLKLVVSDTGIGIEKGELDHIFEEFHQAGTLSTRKHGGTGLGLAIVKKFVNLLGGDIGVESEVGKGSTFTVTLPLTHITRTDSKFA